MLKYVILYQFNVQRQILINCLLDDLHFLYHLSEHPDKPNTAILAQSRRPHTTEIKHASLIIISLIHIVGKKISFAFGAWWMDGTIKLLLLTPKLLDLVNINFYSRKCIVWSNREYFCVVNQPFKFVVVLNQFL